jgi:hypothetical protein
LGKHLVFSLHFTAFSMIVVFIGIRGSSTLLLRVLAHYGVKFHITDWRVILAPIAYFALALYAFSALRRVYGDSALMAALKSVVLVAAFHYVVDVYQFILVLAALYSS